MDVVVPPQSVVAPVEPSTVELAALQATDAHADAGQSALPTCAPPRSESAAQTCAPPRAFVTGLCHGAFPDVALAMFASGTPWKRAYVVRDLERSDAARMHRARGASALGRDEEVIVLVDRTGGPDLAADGSYDVLRWDGTCASLMAYEVGFDEPLVARNADIPWRRLSARTRDALTADRNVASAAAEQRRACQGEARGSKNPACRNADLRLTALTVDRVRRGAPLPAPEQLP